MLVIRRVDRINAAEHHRMDFLEARQYARRIPRVRDRVAHLHFLRRFDVRREISRLAHFQFLADIRLRIETADLLDLHIFAGMQQLHLLPGLQFAVKDAHMRDHALVSVEKRIERQRLQTRRARRLRRRNPRHNRLQDFVNANALPWRWRESPSRREWPGFPQAAVAPAPRSRAADQSC